jgi:hypothetical protein
MSWNKHDDNYPYFKPALISVDTGLVLADDSPEKVAAGKLWAETTLKERQAFHRVTCLSSRNTQNLLVMTDISNHIEAALKAL